MSVGAYKVYWVDLVAGIVYPVSVNTPSKVLSWCVLVASKHGTRGAFLEARRVYKIAALAESRYGYTKTR